MSGSRIWCYMNEKFPALLDLLEITSTVAPVIYSIKFLVFNFLGTNFLARLKPVTVVKIILK